MTTVREAFASAFTINKRRTTVPIDQALRFLGFGPHDRVEDARQAMLDDLFGREVSAA
jgi:hypothetical protein